MVFNATFNSISVISWWSVLLEEETGVPKAGLTVFHYLSASEIWPEKRGGV
jgi:hypothetical protein